MPSPYVGFRAIADLGADLESRAEIPTQLGPIAQRDLARYYAIVQRSTPTFAPDEAVALVDALRNLRLESPDDARLLWTTVADAVEMEQTPIRFGLDGVTLVARIQSLTFTESLALVDAVERYWLLATDSPRNVAGMLATVGLIKH